MTVAAAADRAVAAGGGRASTSAVHRIGVPTSDAEHDELAIRFVGLLAALGDGRDLRRFALGLRDFVARVRAHFRGEEARMRASGYPDAAAHEAEHDRLLVSAAEFLDAVEGHYESFDCWGVALYFKRWLVNHVGGADARFERWVAQSHERAPETSGRRSG